VTRGTGPKPGSPFATEGNNIWISLKEFYESHSPLYEFNRIASRNAIVFVEGYDNAYMISFVFKHEIYD
jgi:hypothetical protein